jgi:hypothetical protein
MTDSRATTWNELFVDRFAGWTFANEKSALVTGAQESLRLRMMK